jgi:hypothetical protein
MTKKEAIEKYCECKLKPSKYDEDVFENDTKEFLVLTDSEANQRCEAYIRDSLWAFNANFLLGYINGVEGSKIEEAIKKMQCELCEDANELIFAMVEPRLDELISDAIGCDGRGHFLAGYDNHEIELDGDYYGYRIN